jgi:glycosyltransferase involved in cell wall biosynthesis
LGLENIALPGFVSAKEKEEMIASAKWVLAPAKTKEDLGLTPIEARNAGVPSIVTRDGGLPESGGSAALIAEPGSVSDLARCMRTAIEMADDEYIERAKIAFDTLQIFLKPMDFYRHAYTS